MKPLNDDTSNGGMTPQRKDNSPTQRQVQRSNQEETVTKDSESLTNGGKKEAKSLLYHHHYHHPNDESSLTFQKSFFSDVATVSQQSEQAATKTVHHIHLHHDNDEATVTSSASNASLRRRRRVGNSDATTRTNDKWSKLENLKMLYNEGYLKKEEYFQRRSQIIDDMTGTSSTAGMSLSDTGYSSGSASRNHVRRRPSRVLNPYVIPRPPPQNFTAFTPEKAMKHTFDLKTRKWTQQPFLVRLDDTPFARGGLRLVYHLQEVEDKDPSTFLLAGMKMDPISEHHVPPVQQIADLNAMLAPESSKGCLIENCGSDGNEEGEDHKCGASSGDPQGPECTNDPSLAKSKEKSKEKGKKKETSYVAKLAIDPYEDPGTYFRDVEMQAHCGLYADLYNSYDPPRKVEFCKAWILELIERDGSPLCGVEKFIEGGTGAAYRKHNNNFGYVNEDERNTPQAFSHFTYEASARTMIVVDIQGVGDMYTDPQIHTIAATDFGKGNLGLRGMKRFLETHRCNSICRYLKLTPVNPKYGLDGTVPAFKHMNKKKINAKQFSEGHYYENSPYLRRVLTEKSMGSTSTTGYSTTTSSRNFHNSYSIRLNERDARDEDYFPFDADDERCQVCPRVQCSIL